MSQENESGQAKLVRASAVTAFAFHEENTDTVSQFGDPAVHPQTRNSGFKRGGRTGASDASGATQYFPS